VLQGDGAYLSPHFPIQYEIVDPDEVLVVLDQLVGVQEL
jgi:hypothetical protein